MAKLVEGQKLWLVEDFRGGRTINPPNQMEVTVVKVGRKFADLSNKDRLIIETMRIDGNNYTSPGKCYLNKEAYDASEGATYAWRELKHAMGAWQPPAGVTIADINAARAILKV